MELKGNDNQDIITPRATAAAIDGTAFRDINPTNAIPEAWEDRAKKAWKYYTEEPLVKNCINSWLAFALGNRIEVSSSDENLNKEARAVAERLDLTRFIKDLFLQLFVKGDGVGFKRAATENTDDLVELISVNPVSIKVKYVDGNLTKVVQVSSQPGSDSLNLPVSQTIHLKWDAPNYADRGNSMVLPAFESIELLRAYRKAERAIAARWTTPFRLVKVGGNYNGKLLMPNQTQLDEVREMLSKMDMKAGLVVPFHVTAETHGNDGHVLDLENKIRSVKEDIMVAMGLSRALVTGDGPNFATASISLKKMMVMIKELKNTAIGVLKWIFKDWVEARGFDLDDLEFRFDELDPNDDIDARKMLIELYDRGLIERNTLLERMDLKQERKRQAKHTFLDERKIKPVIDLVNMGIIGVETAQEILGVDKLANPPYGSSRVQATWGGLMSPCLKPGQTCEGCGHLEDGVCLMMNIERRSEALACDFFEKRLQSEME